MNAAILGTGAVGGYHIKAQLELGSNVTVYDPSLERAHNAARMSGNVVVARTLEEAIEEADVVHVCSPPMMHMENALASISLGRPTIIEKPFTHDLGEAVTVYKAAQAAGVPVLIGKHFRLTPPFLDINQRMHEIGPVISIESTYVHDMGRLNMGAEWRKALGPNGFMYEGAAHPVDLNVWLAGQPVTEVQATISKRKVRPEYRWAEDLTLTLTYEDGTVGRVWSNASAPIPKHGASVAVYGDKGALRAHNKYPRLETYRDGDAEWTITDTAPVGQTIRPMAKLFYEYIRAERSSVAPMPTLTEALGVMIVLDTLEKAAASGQTERVPTLQEVLSR